MRPPRPPPPPTSKSATDQLFCFSHRADAADEEHAAQHQRCSGVGAKIGAAEQAQRRLCQERRDHIPASALMPVGMGALEDKLDRLTADVQKLTERMAGLSSESLSTDKSEPRRRTPLRCWHCRQPGHVFLPPALTPQT